MITIEMKRLDQLNPVIYTYKAAGSIDQAIEGARVRSGQLFNNVRVQVFFTDAQGAAVTSRIFQE